MREQDDGEDKPAKRASRRRYVRFTQWRRGHFFRVMEETGHAQMAAEAAGVSLACIYRLRRVEAGFADRMDSARARADARLKASAAEASAAEEGSHARNASNHAD